MIILTYLYDFAIFLLSLKVNDKMKKIFILFMATMGLMLGGANISHASQGFIVLTISAPPPISPPRGLPPIPENGVSPTNNPPPPPGHLPVPPSTTNTARPVPTQTSQEGDTARAEVSYSLQVLSDMLQAEVDRISNSVGREMAITLLNTDNSQYKQFISSGILKMDEQEFSAHDHSLSALLHEGGRFNYTQTPICYILFDPKRGEQLWNGFIVPLGDVSHLQTGAAFLIAHEVGHCLDGLERGRRLNQRPSWRASDARELGLWPDAVRDSFGEQFSKDAYLQNPRLVSRHLTQQQYQERAADAFASFWIMRLGADDKSLDVLQKIRNRFSPDRPHFTSPVYPLVKNNATHANRQERVDVIWSMARDVQVRVGVDSQAIDASKRQKKPVLDPYNVKYVVTSHGPVRVDSDGNPVEGARQNRNTGQNFNSLPRFGGN